jgi:hypothetical protein
LGHLFDGGFYFCEDCDFVGGGGGRNLPKKRHDIYGRPVVLRYVLVDSGYSAVLGESAKRIWSLQLSWQIGGIKNYFNGPDFTC